MVSIPGAAEISKLNVQLPLIGKVGIIGIAAAGIIVYLAFFRKKRATSKTVITRYSK